MIAAAKTAIEEYKDYIKAFEDLGAAPFLSLSEEDAEGADALVLPGSRQDMNPKLWGEEDQGSNDINDVRHTDTGFAMRRGSQEEGAGTLSQRDSLPEYLYVCTLRRKFLCQYSPSSGRRQNRRGPYRSVILE